MNNTNWEKYKRVLHAVELGCNKASLIKERFGSNGVYIVKKLVLMGCVSYEKGNIYKKIQDLPFTNL